MKKWSSVVLALALLAMPPFVAAQPESPRGTAVPEAACCCCSPEKAHSETASCQCDGCAQKNARCGCVQAAPASAALPTVSVFAFELPLSGKISICDVLYAGRTDSPLLRPPIIS